MAEEEQNLAPQTKYSLSGDCTAILSISGTPYRMPDCEVLRLKDYHTITVANSGPHNHWLQRARQPDAGGAVQKSCLLCTCISEGTRECHGLQAPIDHRILPHHETDAVALAFGRRPELGLLKPANPRPRLCPTLAESCARTTRLASSARSALTARKA